MHPSPMIVALSLALSIILTATATTALLVSSEGSSNNLNTITTTASNWHQHQVGGPTLSGAFQNQDLGSRGLSGIDTSRQHQYAAPAGVGLSRTSSSRQHHLRSHSLYTSAVLDGGRGEQFYSAASATATATTMGLISPTESSASFQSSGGPGGGVSPSAAVALNQLMNGQCPILHSDPVPLLTHSNSHSKVNVDPATGRRTFNARIVGIFSCLDGESSANDLTLDFRLAKPVIDLAVRTVNSRYSQMHFNVTYRTAPDICKHQQAAGHAADEYYVNGANFLVGPGCSESLASVGQLASYWNVPMCSTGYLPEIVTARFKPRTLMQLSLSVQSVGDMIHQLFQMYRWRHLVIVTDEKHPLYPLIRDGLLEFFHTMYISSSQTSQSVSRPQLDSQQQQQQSYRSVGGSGGTLAQSQQQQKQQQQQSLDALRIPGQQQLNSRIDIRNPYYINITSRNFADQPNVDPSKRLQPIDYEQVMLDAATYSRIMLLLVRSDTLQKLMLAAHRQGMSKGQFVFIAHELLETQHIQENTGGNSGKSSSSPGNPFVAFPTVSHPQQQQHHQQHFQQQQQQKQQQRQQQQQQQDGARQKYALDDRIEIQSSKGGNSSSHDLIQSEIFQGLMTISLRIPISPELSTFRQEVAALTEREFNYRVGERGPGIAYSLSVAALIYDCVMLYADKVNIVLNKTQFSKINGKTIFDLAADKTFKGALTGDLTINKAGQRVIDFTLNDFSPETLTLEPLAHFKAIDRQLSFLPGKHPHWVLRNQSTPRSDPRCRITDLFCRYSDEDDEPNLLNSLNNERFVLGVWLLVIIIGSVAFTSSIIGWLVYRRFRIESELLNLWWSIKYEDILFEDVDADVMCDGKRSMSSLAISNESFNERATGGDASTATGGTGRISPQQLKAPAPTSGHQHANSANLSNGGGGGGANESRLTATNNSQQQQDCQSTGNLQLSVSHSPGEGASLSAAHSTSTLSVTAPSIGGSTSVLASTAPGSGALTSSLQFHNSTSGGGSGSSARGASCSGGAGGATSNSAAAALNTLNSGASKLIPLINRSSSGGGAIRAPASRGDGGGGGSGKFSGSSTQLGASKARVGGGGGGGANASTGAGAGSVGGGVGGTIGPPGGATKDPSLSSQNRYVKLKLGTVLNGGRDQTHTTKVGLYKASRVAAKHLSVRNLNINRQLLIELRQVRDLTHENLIKFIGLCPEEPNVAIVSELCTRGNLQDLLQNESIRLDWSFRYSIINDIVDGLIHLHSSPIQYHGRLKSSNCVIDNRFVVKLTDFGLPTLLASVEHEENVNPRLLLWTAPEHLRTKHPLLSGSQKGDIYSLAIIFQEIITRCGPFECEPILCGASEVGTPIVLQQQQQQQAPLIRTTEVGAGPLRVSSSSGGGGRRGGTTMVSQTMRTGGAPPMAFRSQQAVRPQQPMSAAINLQAFGGMPLLQPIVVQHKQRLEPEEIVNLVRMGLSPPFRPYFRPDVASTMMGGSRIAQQQQQAAGQATSAASADFNVSELIFMVQNCWQEAPAQRPTITNVKQQIKKMRRGCHLDGSNLMDNLLQRMERYTDNLESLVEQKTAELMEEKKRSEELLYEMLPRFVVDQLKYGHSVTPEAYEAVTISFSDIKDFTSIAAQSSPIQVVNLLNQLYTEFDDCIAQYDVYKVETIGDAYMVVSGLPIRNGDQHAKEIAEMSLALLELIRNFDVTHLPHVNLELRIGIHSGPCASGVVGTRMFRYCLFGDTVNTASRMESHGEPMKIHISEDTANILARFGNFVIEPRGLVEIKGKGMMSTYWLAGKTDYSP